MLDLENGNANCHANASYRGAPQGKGVCFPSNWAEGGSPSSSTAAAACYLASGGVPRGKGAGGRHLRLARMALLPPASSTVARPPMGIRPLHDQKPGDMQDAVWVEGGSSSPPTTAACLASATSYGGVPPWKGACFPPN
jgi:hypothetical protein